MKTTVVNKNYELYDVYIGRPSKWGNPFRPKGRSEKARLEAIRKYALWIAEQPELLKAAKTELRGKRLGCYCKPKPCHGDILAEIADA